VIEQVVELAPQIESPTLRDANTFSSVASVVCDWRSSQSGARGVAERERRRCAEGSDVEPTRDGPLIGIETRAPQQVRTLRPSRKSVGLVCRRNDRERGTGFIGIEQPDPPAAECRPHEPIAA